VLATKGWEQDTLLTPSQVAADVLGDVPVVSLAGPVLAAEILAGSPTGILCASRDRRARRRAAAAHASPAAAVFTTSDVAGTETAAAFKKDLYVTCQHGRNGRFGRLLGSGATVEGAIRSIGSTVEGVANTRAALRLAARTQLDLPTAHAVDLALTQDLTGERVSDQLWDLFLAVVSGSRSPGDPRPGC
jgi:glycerol-3-phosphate dehydrogenase